MPNIFDGTSVPPHGMFFMESTGGYHSDIETPDEEHQPSCFGLEEEKGEHWDGTGATRPLLAETRPTL
jgi:hypothetical protein